MNGELAQCCALAVHGSRWLARPEGSPPDLAGNTTFRWVRSVEFGLERGRFSPPLVAQSTGQWFEQLRDRAAVGIRVRIQEGRRVLGMPRYHGAAFAGSDQWALAVLLADGRTELWQGQWAVNRGPGDPMPPGQKIWDVRYIGTTRKRAPDPAPDVAGAQRRLIAAVEAARAFATEEGWTDWADWLAKASAIAASDAPEAPFHTDIVPATARLDVRRLFASAGQAWVFGGMGWWNDMGPAQGREQAYDRVTSALYDAVLDGIATAANAAGQGP